MPRDAILAIDQGTTSSRSMLFGTDAAIQAQSQQEFRQIFPEGGWVEHDPEDIWQSCLVTLRDMHGTLEGKAPAVIGITNQRETTIIWDRASGRPVYNAIVWQDRRTAPLCHRLKESGAEAEVTARTGLLLDPYFSATKIAWILDHVSGARERAERGELAFGTVDSFLLWRLTGGRVHATDATNASRTNLYNIHTGEWDEELLRLFNIPRAILPEVRDCASDFGTSDPAVCGFSATIGGIAGDQQAAAIGQGCLAPGEIKSTYGTGCFVLVNTGGQALNSANKLLTTIAYRLNGETSYALEGSIFVAGAAIQWLRDGLGIIESAADTEALAAGLDDNHGVYLVPAFTGLGAPYWDPEARGAISGLTRDTGPAHIARAALEAIAYQTSDLLAAMAADGVSPSALRVDGGMVANSWFCQFLADILALPVDRPKVTETTALGAAFLAGMQAGIYGGADDIRATWQQERHFAPTMAEEERRKLLNGWAHAVAMVRMKE